MSISTTPTHRRRFSGQGSPTHHFNSSFHSSASYSPLSNNGNHFPTGASNIGKPSVESLLPYLAPSVHPEPISHVTPYSSSHYVYKQENSIFLQSMKQQEEGSQQEVTASNNRTTSSAPVPLVNSVFFSAVASGRRDRISGVSTSSTPNNVSLPPKIGSDLPYGNFQCMTWSQCGNFLFFLDTSSQVWRLNANQGSFPHRIWNGGLHEIYSMKASVQGSLIISAKERDTNHCKLVHIEKATGNADEIQEISLANSEFDFVWDIQFHPKFSHLIAFHAWNRIQSPMPWNWSKIVLYSLKTKKYKLLAGSKEMSCAEPRFSPNGQKLSFLSDKNGRYGLFSVQLSSREKVERRETLIEASEEVDLLTYPSMTPQSSHYAWLDNENLVYIQNEHGFCNLALYSLEEKKSTPLLHNPDLEQQLLTQKSKVLSSPPRSPASRALSPELSDVDSSTSQILPRGVFSEIQAPILTGYGEDLYFFCKYSAPTEPTKYLRVNATRNTYEVLSQSHPKLPTLISQHLVTPTHFEYETKDKEIVHGTLYVGGQGNAAKDLISLSGLNLPVICLVHDGPCALHTVDYNPVVQFFASRGFIVFCPNYRGSSGYGREYRESLNGNFGNFDVEDCFEGLQYLLSLGVADGSKCIVMGQGTGATTSLHLLNRYPEYFTAGVAISPILDLIKFRQTSHQMEKYKFESLVGPIATSSKQHHYQSPINQVQNVASPLLLLHGANDTRCAVDLVRKYATKVEQNGTEVEYHEYEHSDHELLRNSLTLIDVLCKMDEFITNHVLFNDS